MQHIQGCYQRINVSNSENAKCVSRPNNLVIIIVGGWGNYLPYDVIAYSSLNEFKKYTTFFQ